MICCVVLQKEGLCCLVGAALLVVIEQMCVRRGTGDERGGGERRRMRRYLVDADVRCVCRETGVIAASRCVVNMAHAFVCCAYNAVLCMLCRRLPCLRRMYGRNTSPASSLLCGRSM